MLRKSTPFIIIASLVNVLLMLYVYYYMTSVIMKTSAVTMTSLLCAIVFLLSLLAAFIAHDKTHTRFTRYWVLWFLWLIVDFYALGLRGEGASNLFQAAFPPMVFLLFYHAVRCAEKVEIITIWAMTLVFMMAFYFNITNLRYMQIDIGDELGYSNLVFWCLCSVPFIFLIKNSLIRDALVVLCVIVVIVTGKRSAFIMIILISLAFVFNKTQKGAKGIIGVMIALILAIVASIVILQLFSGSVGGLFTRMQSIRMDEGSGRIPIYRDVINSIKQFNFIEWLVGKGYGSIKLTGHTNAHNDALQMLFEYGLFGLVYYVLLFFLVINRLLIVRKARSHYYMGYMATVIVFIVYGMVGNLVVFYGLFSLICAYWGIVEARMTETKMIKKLIIDK